MERRNCCQVINKMMELVPKDRADFIKDLEWNFEDASYKAPEETLQWQRTMRTLQKHIPMPKQDWEFEVLHIFTTKSIEQIKQEIAEWKNQEREKRVKIFEDTKRLTSLLKRDSKTYKHNFSDIVNPIVGGESGFIGVASSDTVSGAMTLSRMGKTCVLNMASSTKAGGGVATGEQAQEECLFRCSNLWETVVQDFYPLQDDECLYTTDAIFFKDKDYDILNTTNQFVVDVVTIAAINLNKDSYYDEKNECWVDVISEKPENYEELTKKKMRLMFSLAIRHRVENIVLGAWGCGVFKNKPDEMAKMFKEVLSEGYANSFKQIYFAVINDSNSNGNNFKSFTDILG